MAEFDNGDFVKVSGSERVYIVDKLLHTQKQTIPVTADLEIYRVLDDDGEEEVVTSPDMKLVKKSIDEPSAAQQSPLSHEIELNVFYLQAMLLTAAKEDIRYYLAGILFKALNGKVWAFSTDGHRLSRWLIKDDYQGPNFEYIVGRDGIQSILEHKADYKDNSIVLDTRCGFLSVAGIAINNLIDGRYPNALDVANKALQLSDDKEAMPLIDAKYMKGLANAARLLGKYRGNSVCASFEHVIRRDNESNTFVVTGIDNYIQVIMPMRDAEENRSKCIDKAMVIADITNPIHKAINEGKFVKCGVSNKDQQTAIKNAEGACVKYIFAYDEAGFMDSQCELWRFAHMIGVAEDD